MQVYAGGRVDPSLISGFLAASPSLSAASSGGTRAAELAVAQRVAELLAAMPTPLLLDMWVLHADAMWRGDSEREVEVAEKLLVQHAAQLGKLVGFVEGLSGSSRGRDDAQVGGAEGDALKAPQPYSDNGAKYQGSAQTSFLRQGPIFFTEGAPSSLSHFGLVPPSTSLNDILHCASAAAASWPDLPLPPLTRQQRLCLTYRSSKKILMWGFLGCVAQAHSVSRSLGSPSKRQSLQRLR